MCMARFQTEFKLAWENQAHLFLEFFLQNDTFEFTVSMAS